jgi:threonine dehydratase
MKLKINPRLVEEAAVRLKSVVRETPLQFNVRLSQKFQARVYLKREDLQAVRSYKIRGAYNRMAVLTPDERKKGVVCASAGNHAQGVAFGCARLKITGYIYLPKNTPKQKLDRIRIIGGKQITLFLVGDSFDEANAAALAFAKKKNKIFIHPFNDPLVIAGQGTVAKEIFNQLASPVDYLVAPVGGGGLIAGIGLYSKDKFPRIKLIGAEPAGAASMHAALKAGHPVALPVVDKFVDGAAVKKVGLNSFALAKKNLNRVVLVPEGLVCQEMIALYQSEGIVAEPAGALSVAALENIKEEIRGRTVVCIVSGGNNDISRYQEIIERSLVYRGLKHYFIINFSQRPGALRRYINEALGPHDDITLFEYIKKNNRENGPALIGIELMKKTDLKPLLRRMDKIDLDYEILKKDSSVFSLIV